MLDGLKAAWDSMTSQERQDKVKALNTVNRLKALCEARGYIKFDMQKLEFCIFHRTEAVKKLLAAIKKAKIVGVKIKDRSKLKN